MRVKVAKKYFRQLKKALQSKQNDEHLKELILGQCHFEDIQQYFSVGDNASYRIQIRKLGNCLFMMDSTYKYPLKIVQSLP